MFHSFIHFDILIYITPIPPRQYLTKRNNKDRGGKMLHSKARKLMVEAYERTHNAKEVAECYSVDESTVYRLKRQKKAIGSVELRTNSCGRKPSLSEDICQQ